jgi:hypothetical protein
LQKLVVIVVDIAILTIICVSLFSGKAAFKTSATTYGPPQPLAGPEIGVTRSHC